MLARRVLLGPREPGGCPASAVYGLVSFLAVAEHGNVVWGVGTIQQTGTLTGSGFASPFCYVCNKDHQNLRVSLAAKTKEGLG